MVSVEVHVHNTEYYFRKKFLVSAAPLPGFRIEFVNGNVMLDVKWVKQNLEEDSFEVFCYATIEQLLTLHQSQTGWQTNDPVKFENDSAVHKAAKNIKKNQERIAQLIEKG